MIYIDIYIYIISEKKSLKKDVLSVYLFTIYARYELKREGANEKIIAINWRLI